MNNTRRVFKRVFGVGALATVDALRPHRNIVEKYSRIELARTAAEARELVRLGNLTQDDLDVLMDHDVALKFDVMAHDGVAGSVSGYAHVVRHSSAPESAISTKYRAMYEQFNTTPEIDAGLIALPYHKSNSRNRTPASTAQNTPTSSAHSTPPQGSRSLGGLPRHSAPLALSETLRSFSGPPPSSIIAPPWLTRRADTPPLSSRKAVNKLDAAVATARAEAGL
jgi:hypothetical protein